MPFSFATLTQLFRRRRSLSTPTHLYCATNPRAFAIAREEDVFKSANKRNVLPKHWRGTRQGMQETQKVLDALTAIYPGMVATYGSKAAFESTPDWEYDFESSHWKLMLEVAGAQGDGASGSTESTDSEEVVTARVQVGYTIENPSDAKLGRSVKVGLAPGDGSWTLVNPDERTDPGERLDEQPKNPWNES